MSRVRDSLDAGDSYRQCSAATRRVVQDGTAIDCLVAAIEAGHPNRCEFARALLEVYVAANDAGELWGETLRPASVAQRWALESLGFTRRRRPRKLG